MLTRILLIIIALLAGITLVEARAEPLSEQWCIPGERITVQGATEPFSELLLRWQDRAVGGGLSTADGIYRLALMIGPEQPGRYTVAVEARRDRQVVRELVCVVPPADWLQPTTRRATGTALPPVPTAEPTATRIGSTVAPLPTARPQATSVIAPTATTAVGPSTQIISSPDTIQRGNRATVAARSTPYSLCDIKVYYGSYADGEAKAEGLDDKTTDSAGNVRWEWLVGGGTNVGEVQITVACGGGPAASTTMMVEAAP